MKKTLCMIALAAISYGSVFAYGTVSNVKGIMQTDTGKTKMKKKGSKMKMKKKWVDTTKKWKDTTKAGDTTKKTSY